MAVSLADLADVFAEEAVFLPLEEVLAVAALFVVPPLDRDDVEAALLDLLVLVDVVVPEDLPEPVVFTGLAAVLAPVDLLAVDLLELAAFAFDVVFAVFVPVLDDAFLDEPAAVESAGSLTVDVDVALSVSTYKPFEELDTSMEVSGHY